MFRRNLDSDLSMLPARDWQEYGSCRHVNGDLFFPPFDVEPTAARLERERAAKAVCQDCPVRKECLDWALTVGEPHGVWGGYSESERRELRLASRAAS